MMSELGGRVSMEAGPRDKPYPPREEQSDDLAQSGRAPGGPVQDRPGPVQDGPGPVRDESGPVRDEPRPVQDGPTPDGLALDELTPDGPDSENQGGESFRELRPPARLRIWEIAPIVGLAAAGSLMFAFPLAFEFGDGGAVVAMLGLLISSCAAGWGLMAGRRAGLTWPGLPPRGSGRRPDWRIVGLYALVVLTIALLAIWRVARLR
ncbi:hypothetical protein [Streptomyces sp. NPDC051776]|uniref:hypothetical protein n=1 Tax=Streptomyces sp. NPDC051776 TaxID=3155414 RepID=UPI0034497982